MNKDFHYAVVRLLAMLNIPDDPATVIQQGFTVRVDADLHIDLIGLQEGFINLRSVVGTLPDPTENAMLLRLLYANDFAFEHPPVSIGVNPESGSITVWSRQALAELRNDVRCAWFDRFLQVASALQQWLNTADHSLALPAPPASTDKQTALPGQRRNTL